MPPQFTQAHGGYASGYGGNHYQGQQHHGHQQHQPNQQYQGGHQHGGYPGQQQQYQGGGQQQQDQNAEIEAAVKKFLPRIIRKLEGCCVVM